MAEEPESSESDLSCVISKVEFSDEKTATTVAKGIPNLEKFAKLQNRDNVVHHITTQRNKEPEGKVYVHPECTKSVCEFEENKKDRSSSPKYSQKEKAT